MLVSSITAAARDTIRRARREKGIRRLVFRFASLALLGRAAFGSHVRPADRGGGARNGRRHRRLPGNRGGHHRP
jgi:hypothetical protein